jgi:hypothetical protein
MWCCAPIPKSANITRRFEILDRPLSRAMTAESCSRPRAPYAAAGTGSAVTDLIFSIAKRDVTFFSGTAPISFL